MSIITSGIAKERSSTFVRLVFTDEDDKAVTPNWIKWSLTKTDGTTFVNSRQQVSVVTPASTVNILLQNLDLAILDGDPVEYRIFSVEAEYDSLTLGNDIPLKDSAVIQIQNLAAIPI